MKLTDLDEDLPNGFHDSQLTKIEIDYERGRVRLFLNILMGVPESKNINEREKYRFAAIDLTGLRFFCIDPPSAGYPFEKRGALSIDGGPGQPSTSLITLPSLEDEMDLYWFFVREWNSFIRVSADKASIEWLEEIQNSNF